MLEAYQKDAGPLFESIDELVTERMFVMKETAHHLFRENVEEDRREIDSTMVLDLIVGSLFHELLRLKESAYLVEQYRPRIAAVLAGGESTDFLEYGQRMVQNSAAQMKDGFTEVEQLFRLGSKSLLGMLRDMVNRRLVLRFLLRHRRLLTEVYGPQRVDEIYRLFYRGGWLEALLVGVDDYVSSGHLPEALRCAEVLCQELERGEVRPCPQDDALSRNLFAHLMSIGKVSLFSARAEKLTRRCETLFSRLSPETTGPG